MKLSISEARQKLSQLLKAVERGEEVEITRRGRVVARLTQPAAREEDGIMRASARQALRDRLPPAQTSSGDLLRELRDSARY